LFCSCLAVVDEFEDIGGNEEAVWSQPTLKDVDVELRVTVPTGYVYAVDRLTPGSVLWQQKVFLCWFS